MRTKFYVDANGNYMGGFSGVEPLTGWEEVPTAPNDARERWINGAWVLPTFPPPIPAIVTMRQARLALLQGGLLSQVDAAIAAMPSPQKEAAEIEWEYSQTVERNRMLVQMLAPALGLSESDLDYLFTLAGAL